MAPLKKIYLEELGRIQDRINGLFEQALLTSDYEDREGGLPGTWSPAVDVLETEDGYLIFAELPGVRRDDIQLQVRDRRLELSGRRQSLGENRNFLRMERSYGPFRRTFDLGQPVDVDNISAGFEKGVLRVHVPKLADGSTQIDIADTAEEAG
ncbi:MAG TPA: Hsp20/alpha crystallin family protein [Thermoanaerobaculia bacterium]|nr:Hsp20/alpha crystallin family protein [Thermoanaerobaculia bacterium]